MIGQLIKQANNSLTQKMNMFARQYDLTGTQMSVIDFLGRCPDHECEQKAIEIEFDIKRSSTTVLLKRLIKKEIIVRYPSSSDSRKKVIKLTSKGEKLLPVVTEYIANDEQKIIQQYSIKDLKMIEQFLSDLAKGGRTNE